MEVNTPDGSFVLIELLEQGAHPVVPQLDHAVVQAESGKFANCSKKSCPNTKLEPNRESYNQIISRLQPNQAYKANQDLLQLTKYSPISL